MKIVKCEKCGGDAPETFLLCPDCMLGSGAAEWQVEAALDLLAIIRALKTERTNKGRAEALQSMLVLANKLKGGAECE